MPRKLEGDGYDLAVRVRDVIRMLEANGWEHVEQRAEASGIQVVKLLIVVEKTSTGYSAYSPDLLGCVATGATREEVEREMRDAIDFHLEGMRAEGEAVPEPSAYSTYIEVPA